MKKYRLSLFINNQKVRNDYSYLLIKPMDEMDHQSKFRQELKTNGKMAGPIRRISGWHEYEYNSS